MRWFAFILFAGFVATVQSAVAPRLALWGSRPDFLLVVVVFLGLRARPFDAFLGAWVLGALGDLMTVERMGLMALSYGLTAMVVASIRDALFRHHNLTQFVVTLLAALGIQSVWCLYRRACYAPALPVALDFALVVGLGSVYTALWAPLLHKVLSPVSRLLGIPRPRSVHAGYGTGRWADRTDG